MSKPLPARTEEEIEMSGRAAGILLNVLFPAWVLLEGSPKAAVDFLKNSIEPDMGYFADISREKVLQDLRTISNALMAQAKQ